jgi:hypothetical protein
MWLFSNNRNKKNVAPIISFVFPALGNFTLWLFFWDLVITILSWKYAQFKLTIPFGGSVAQFDKSDKARPAWWANDVPPRLPSKCQHCWVSSCPQYSHQFCNIKNIADI